LLGGVLLSAGVAIGSRLLRRTAPPTYAATLPLPITPRGRWGAEAPRHVAPGEFGFYDARVNRSGWRQYDEPLDQILRTIVVHHSALPLSDGPRKIQLSESGHALPGCKSLPAAARTRTDARSRV
jgi:hypothetical protein